MVTRIMFCFDPATLADILGETWSRKMLVSHGLNSEQWVKRCMFDPLPEELPENFAPRPEFVGLDPRASNPTIPEVNGIPSDLERFLGDHHSQVTVWSTPEEQAEHFELRLHAAVANHRLIVDLSIGVTLEFKRVASDSIQMWIVASPSNYSQVAMLLSAIWLRSKDATVVQEARNIVMFWLVPALALINFKGATFFEENCERRGEAGFEGFYESQPDWFKQLPTWKPFG